jgi:hypothetical protein
LLLNAKQLYFIGVNPGDYGYIDRLPPVQTIAYTPTQDTLLHIYKDYTKILQPKPYINIKRVEFYHEHKVFIFKLFDNAYLSYALYADNPYTIIKMPARCPEGYSVDPFLSMNIVKHHWAYDCSCDNSDVADSDYSRFKGIDFSLIKHSDLTASDFKDLYLTGNVAQRVELRPNEVNMYLPIVAGIKNRPPFSMVLPQRYWVDKKTFTVIWVNDHHKTLVEIKRVNPVKSEDFGHFHAALYNKNTDTWRDIELKGNYPGIMAYGCYLAGFVQDAADPDTRFSIIDKVSSGKAVRDSVAMENSFDEKAAGMFYRPGILYLYNTDNNKYIEWSTGQGDSEILLVEDETVYYRVFNAIYKVLIINGEKLGKAELLVRDNGMVPYIHYAFFGPDLPQGEPMAIVSAKAVIYSEPGVATRSYLIKGDKITVLDERSGWLKMEYYGTKRVTGWVKKTDAGQ